jgi:tRNA A37 N6-isopentenylltransferase MiaA
MSKTYDMLEEGQPMETFRQRVRYRLEVGKTYKFWVTVHSEEPHHTRERKRVQKKMTVVAFYPNVVHLRRKNGISECFGYQEAWRMLCRDDEQGDI